MRKQQRNYPSRVRSSGGQTTRQSFLFKSTVVDGEVKPSPPPPPPPEKEKPISPRQPPKRGIIRVTKATTKLQPTKPNRCFLSVTMSLKREMLRGGIWQPKASAFSSVGSPSSGKSLGSAASGPTVLNAAVFKRFNCSVVPAARAEAASTSGCVAELAGDGDGGGLSVPAGGRGDRGSGSPRDQEAEEPLRRRRAQQRR